jgi:hypothetical protein
MKTYHSKKRIIRKNISVQKMSAKISGEELLDALFRLRVVARNRIPPIGFERGQAVGPEDKAAQLIILQWLLEKYPDSVLPSLMEEKDPTATIRVFNQFIDGISNFEETLEEFCMQARDLGHEPTVSEYFITVQLLDEALSILNSPLNDL